MLVDDIQSSDFPPVNCPIASPAIVARLADDLRPHLVHVRQTHQLISVCGSVYRQHPASPRIDTPWVSIAYAATAFRLTGLRSFLSLRPAIWRYPSSNLPQVSSAARSLFPAASSASSQPFPYRRIPCASGNTSASISPPGAPPRLLFSLDRTKSILPAVLR